MPRTHIRTGILSSLYNCLSAFDGKKPVPLAVKLNRQKELIKEYLIPWQEEHLAPARDEWNEVQGRKKGAEIPAEELEEFVEAHAPVFEMEVEIPITPIKLSSIPDNITIHEDALGMLLTHGLATDDTG